MKKKQPKIFTHDVIAMLSLSLAHSQVGAFTKAQVADRIRKVEDGVDEFNKYLENRGENARSKAQSAQSGGNIKRVVVREVLSSNTQARQDQAKRTKDELQDAMDDLNQSTNRLRRKFDPTSNYIETKVQMERVMDSGRRVNQVMTRGDYGTQAERYWTALWASINDLARCYGITPMGV